MVTPGGTVQEKVWLAPAVAVYVSSFSVPIYLQIVRSEAVIAETAPGKAASVRVATSESTEQELDMTLTLYFLPVPGKVAVDFVMVNESVVAPVANLLYLYQLLIVFPIDRLHWHKEQPLRILPEHPWTYK